MLLVGCGQISENDLKTGDCISIVGSVNNQSFERLDCSEDAGLGVSKVVWNRDAEGDFPGAVDSLANSCRGISIVPSKESWDDGDKNVICLETHLTPD